MRTLSTNKKKNHSMILYLVIGAALLIAGTLFTLWNHNIGPFAKADANKGTLSVAYLDAAAGAGTDASSVVTYHTVSDGTIVSDDCITKDDDITGYVLKTDVQANTMLTWSMLSVSQNTNGLDNTARYVEVSYVDLQSYLKVGDYIDIRLKTYNTTQGKKADVAANPDAEYRDDVVVAKKEVVALDGTTMTLSMSEEELLLLQAAGVDMTIVNSTKNDTETAATLYVTIYVNPTLQKAHTVTYSNDDVVQMLRKNPGLAESIINPSDADKTENNVQENNTKSTATEPTA